MVRYHTKKFQMPEFLSINPLLERIKNDSKFV